MAFDLERNELKAEAERSVAGALSGCMYATFIIVISGGMLLVNAFLCLTIYAALPKIESPEIAVRVEQMFYFVAPVLLMVVEWNLLDRVQRLFRNDE